MSKKITDLRTKAEKLDAFRGALQAEFEQETGQRCITPSWSDNAYPDEYTHWLENKMINMRYEKQDN